MNLSAVLIILVQLSQGIISVDFDFSARPGSVEITPSAIGSGEYHSTAIPGFQSSSDGIIPPGAPPFPTCPGPFFSPPGPLPIR